MEDGIPLCIQRQAVRLLAMLASDKAGAAAVQDAGWIPWLQDLAVSSDLKLSSCASRALLHIESSAAAQRRGLTKLALPLHAVPAPLLPLEQQAAAAAAAGAGQAAVGDAARPPSPVVAEAAEMLGEARQKMAQVRGVASLIHTGLGWLHLTALRPAPDPSLQAFAPSLCRCGGGWTDNWTQCGLRSLSSSGWSCRWAAPASCTCPHGQDHAVVWAAMHPECVLWRRPWLTEVPQKGGKMLPLPKMLPVPTRHEGRCAPV